MTSDSNATTPSHAVQCFRSLAAAATDQQLCGSDVACLAVILNRYNLDKGYAWPSVDGIAKDAGIHRSNVMRAISRLESAGYLTVHRGGNGRSNRYVPSFQTSRADATSRAGATGSTDATEPVAPVRLELVAPARPEHIHRTYPENISKHSREKARSDRFDEFWSGYPRKEGSKEKARKSWARQKLDAAYDRIAGDIAKRVQGDPQWQSRQFIPHPLTYLNQQRWQDDWKPEFKKPSATDNFEGKTYVGTPIEHMHPSLRPVGGDYDQ